MLQFLLFKVASILVPHVPVSLTYALSWCAAEVAYRVARGPRKAVEANLRHVLGPHTDPSALARAVRGVFHTSAYNYVDMFLIPRIRPEELAQRVTLQHSEIFFDAFAAGKGIVLTTAHFGNFDLLVQLTALYRMPLTVLVEHVAPEALFQLVVALRASHGIRLLPTGAKAVRELLQALGKGEVVGVVADRSVQNRGVAVPFFGEDTLLPTGAVELAMHHGAPLVPGFGLRLPGRRYQITFEQPITLEQEGPKEEALARNVQRLAEVMERHIREHPEQWVVFTPIWPQGGPRPFASEAMEQNAIGARR